MRARHDGAAMEHLPAAAGQARAAGGSCCCPGASRGNLRAVAKPDPYVGKEILAGQFKVLERIGAGGMGSVYKAHQPSMDRHVAVKILHAKFTSRKDLASRFRREARAMSHLTHPNTAKVYLFGQLEDNACYIVMEHLEGRNLGQLVRQDGAMPAARAIAVLIQACGALEEAHQKGIIHRDLKPENIFLCKQGGIDDYVKVLDFGLAKVTEREIAPGSLILTQEGMVFGTPEFMSPEQAQGKALDPRSDVYSLAIILYELVTTKLPFDARSPMEFITLHVQATPIPISERAPELTFPPGFNEVLMKAMAKNPDDRYQSAAEFAGALGALVSDDVAVRQAMSAIPDNVAFAQTQPSQYSIKPERSLPPQNPPQPPYSPAAPQAPPPPQQAPALTAPYRPPGRIDSAQAARATADERPRRGLPVAALIGVGVAIGVAITLVYLLLIR
jgi:eukaryotic-like serine/threonine-protein kinase